ncbi:MAG: hypothetical protein ACRDH9_02625 [Actinomycetota bacterium]
MQQEPGSRSPIEDQPELDDPYADLENVFDEPIVLEDADIQGLDPEDEQPRAAARPASAPATGATTDQGGSDVWARITALEAEVRGGSERTLEALRRLGERIGSELAMLDKRAINLELTLARLRSLIEASTPGARKPPQPPSETETPPDR